MLLPFFAFGIAALALAILGLAGPAHRLGLSLGSAYTIIRWTANIGGAAALVAIVAGVLAYRARAWLRLTIAALALGIGVTSFIIGFDTERRATSRPAIHDITADLEELRK